MMAQQEWIRIRGARQHYLKNLSIDLPKNQLVVITGPSGSGKSSLAFDTLFAEGQRRYLQSLSAYARQFIDQLEKPDVDSIEGLCPAIAIEQRSALHGPRSTIATATEIYDYLRIVYANCGQRHHPETGKPLVQMTTDQIADAILACPEGTPFLLLASVFKDQKGDCRDVIERLKKEGYVRARIDGEICLLEEVTKLNRQKTHTIEVVIDRLKVSADARSRVTQSLELAFKVGGGVAITHWPESKSQEGDTGTEKSTKNSKNEANSSKNTKNGIDQLWSSRPFDPETGYHFVELRPQHFSFNSPLGACPNCSGMGVVHALDPDLMIGDPTLSLKEGVFIPWARTPERLAAHYQHLLERLAKFTKVSLDTPWEKLPDSFKQLLFYGSGKISIPFGASGNSNVQEMRPFEGAIALIDHLYKTSQSELTRHRIRQWMTGTPCSVCNGARLNAEARAVTLSPNRNNFFEAISKHTNNTSSRAQNKNNSQNSSKGLSIDQLCNLSIGEILRFIRSIPWTNEERITMGESLRQIESRLEFLERVGVHYLTLNRTMDTLSGGEAQRIRLATQIGSGLSGVLYVLDEPSIGLHPSEQARLLSTLTQLRDIGNCVVVVEHDEATIRAADWIIDMGPSSGRRGGEIMAEGTVDEILENAKSVTGPYLSGKREVKLPRTRLCPGKNWLTIAGAREHNLKDITVRFPLGLITCVTGVSGSGKSTLIHDILCKALMRHFYGAKEKPGAHDRIAGLNELDKIIVIDQSPIGRTPRSNALTYTGAFNGIRDLFSQLPASRVRGYTAGRFSFNVPGGRCEHCDGDGVKKIEMNFMADVYVTCPLCQGERFNRETLEITYKGHNIADVLRLSVYEGLEIFGNVATIAPKLEALAKVGLGYLPMGQPATSLSGGEAQRIKLATELAKRTTGRTLIVMDEPTTGLHPSDIEHLLAILAELSTAGNTIIIIEHELDVIASADYIIDLGPGGGPEGGKVVATGTPEEIVSQFKTPTALALKEHFARHKKALKI